MARNKEIPYKIYLEESEMPKQWYNLRADMKNKPAPLLNPATMKPMTAEELADQQRAELEKELAAKSAAIRRLQKDLHEGSRKLSHVAAPNPGYSSLSKKSR